MRRARRAFTLIELSVGLVLIGLVMTVAFSWAAISTKTANVALRGALRTSDQERLLGGLREDLAQAVRLAPEEEGFSLELTREDGGVDRVRYACVPSKTGKRLLRTFTPASGAAAERRVASDVEACTVEKADARTFRVRVKWAGDRPGGELLVEVVRRVGLTE
ncbi:MAG: type II secretion system protein [Planctomycetota bacterium]